ncbi:MAG: pyrroline-5-carboxylate reductase [Pseudomonadota bacterium]
MLPFQRFLVVGAGKMGGALVEGWLAQGVPPSSITLIDPAFTAGLGPWTSRGVTCLPSLDTFNGDAPDLLMLAVKPQMMGEVLPALASFDRGELTVVSIAAGTTLETLQSAFPKATLVRTMPNTPAAIGAGMTAAYSVNEGAATRGGVTTLLEAVGKVIWVDSEDAMDAVTAVSGSGPAYVFHMVEALAEAGESLGLSAETAQILARQTVVGAGALLGQSDETAAQLRCNVTSPGGTTAAGLAELMETGRLADLMRNTVKAAHRRSRELAASKPVSSS